MICEAECMTVEKQAIILYNMEILVSARTVINK